MATLSLLANRPANWNVLGVSSLNPAAGERQLHASTVAAERGAKVVALTLPHTMKIRLSFEHGTVIDGLPGWREIFGLPIPERMERLGRPCGATEARRGRPLEGGRHPRRAGRLAEPGHRRDLRSGERRVGRAARSGTSPPSVGRSPSTPWSTSSLADELAHRAPPADPRVGGRLGAPRQGVGGPPHDRRRIRRRGPSRHDLRRDLLHLDARRRGAQAQAAELGVGDPRADRRPGPPLRPARTGGGWRRGGSPTWWCSTPSASAIAPSAPATTFPAVPAGSTPRRRASSTCWSTGPRWCTGGQFTGATPGAVLRSGKDTDTVTVPGGARR